VEVAEHEMERYITNSDTLEEEEEEEEGQLDE